MLDILWVIGRIAETIRNFATNVAAYGGITGTRVAIERQYVRFRTKVTHPLAFAQWQYAFRPRWFSGQEFPNWRSVTRITPAVWAVRHS
jgi:hypothetical protein